MVDGFINFNLDDMCIINCLDQVESGYGLLLTILQYLSAALEACQSIKCPVTVRVLEENDVLVSSIPERGVSPIIHLCQVLYLPTF